jgi:hypothetical protein
VLLGGEATVYRGYGGIRDFFRETGDVLDRVYVEYSEIRDLGDQVVAVGTIRTRGKASGVETDSPIGTVIDFRDARRSGFGPTWPTKKLSKPPGCRSR